jgi:hypothetical protein
LKHCGANKEGGGGFQPGNSCGKESGGTATADEDDDAEDDPEEVFDRILAKPYHERTKAEQQTLWTQYADEPEKLPGAVQADDREWRSTQLDLDQEEARAVQSYTMQGKNYKEARQRGRDWAEGKPDEAWDSVYRQTQEVIGDEPVLVYRGYRLNQDEPLFKEIERGMVGPGTILETSHASFESWSGTFLEAEMFARGIGKRRKEGQIGIVVETVAPAKDVAMSALNLSEYEIDGVKQRVITEQNEVVLKRGSNPQRKVRIVGVTLYNDMVILPKSK